MLILREDCNYVHSACKVFACLEPRLISAEAVGHYYEYLCLYNGILVSKKNPSKSWPLSSKPVEHNLALFDVHVCSEEIGRWQQNPDIKMKVSSGPFYVTNVSLCPCCRSNCCQHGMARDELLHCTNLLFGHFFLSPVLNLKARALFPLKNLR